VPRTRSLPLSPPDWLLVFIPVPLLLAVLFVPISSMPAHYLLGIGAIPSGGSVGYALFRSPTARQ
jgi:hypothetical protein